MVPLAGYAIDTMKITLTDGFIPPGGFGLLVF